MSEKKHLYLYIIFKKMIKKLLYFICLLEKFKICYIKIKKNLNKKFKFYIIY